MLSLLDWPKVITLSGFYCNTKIRVHNYQSSTVTTTFWGPKNNHFTHRIMKYSVFKSITEK